MKYFAAFLSSLLFALGSIHAQDSLSSASQFDGLMRRAQSGVQEAFLPTIEPSSHAANLLQLKNGDLLCFWFSGIGEGRSGVAIVVSRLNSGSRQWSKPIVIDRQAGASYQNPVPFEAPDGTVWLIHTTQPADQGQMNARVLVVKSHDQGRTWGIPQVLFDKPGAFVRNRIVIRPDGAWLLPMYFTPSAGITTGAETNYSVVKISKDLGATWSDCPVPDSNGYVQPSIVPLSKSSYVAFFRSRFADFIFRSTSTDGCTWSAPKATSLPNNNASIQAVGLKDGRIAVAFNNAHAANIIGKPSTGPRKPLTVALSSDGGNTWSASRDVELGRQGAINNAREEYSYPSILQEKNGAILVAYTFLRQTIKVVEFPESWIENVPATKP
jgi:predicted neuraminidase